MVLVTYMKYKWIRVLLSDGTYAYFFGNKKDKDTTEPFNGWSIRGPKYYDEYGNNYHFQNGILDNYIISSDDTYTITMH